MKKPAKTLRFFTVCYTTAIRFKAKFEKCHSLIDFNHLINNFDLGVAAFPIRSHSLTIMKALFLDRHPMAIS